MKVYSKNPGRLKNGHIELPKNPGLGFEIDEQVMEQNVGQYQEELGGEYFYKTDGSVADW